MSNVVRKQTKGRQKIEIKKLEDKNTLQVTFSKRRAGLFRKASELCVSCGAEVAIVTFSPGNKAFAFGNPSSETVIDQFLSGNAVVSRPPPPPNCHVHVKEQKKQYLEALCKFEVEKEKERGERKEEEGGGGERKEEEGGGGERVGFWWELPIEGLELEEVEQFKASLQEFRENVAFRINEMMMEKANAAAAVGCGGSLDFPVVEAAAAEENWGGVKEQLF